MKNQYMFGALNVFNSVWLQSTLQYLSNYCHEKGYTLSCFPHNELQ